MQRYEMCQLGCDRWTALDSLTVPDAFLEMAKKAQIAKHCSDNARGWENRLFILREFDEKGIVLWEHTCTIIVATRRLEEDR